MFAKRTSALIILIGSLFAVNITIAADSTSERPFLHPLFSDHAVIQRGIKVPVWGWTVPGEKVTVSFAGQEKEAIAGPDGKWMVTLKPMKASSEPKAMTVTSSGNHQTSTIKDVLVGDVWICSGQSNMEMGIGVCNVPDEIAAADFPMIRLMTVPKKTSYKPESTFECAWLPCSPATVAKDGWGGFSAAGYFFGRELHRELKVPIGLINSSWGGTIAEAWTSFEALKNNMPDFLPALDQITIIREAIKCGGQDKIVDNWYKTKDPGTAKEWFKPETDASTWKEATMPQAWEKLQGMANYDGIVWFQRTFEAPAAWAGKELVISLGPIDDIDTTWVNGVFVGQSENYSEPRVYKVPGTAVKPGRNVIAIRVLDTGGNGGLWGTPEQMKVYPAGDEAAAISLAGPWRMQDTASLAQTGPVPSTSGNNPNTCTVLYNGMIAPLLPFPIKGAIWYQGESNAGRAYQYRALLQTMIKDWRSRFGVGDFGFYIVSLANFMQVNSEPCDNDWAELREAQAMATKALPNCGIAMAIDIGDAADIHPKNKKEVGRRLALSALAITYGKKIEWSGPWYKSMKVTGKGAEIEFDHVDGGLVAKGDKLTGFAIAGEDKKFAWADAVIDGKKVIVSSPKVTKPVAVRYGWAANPVCNLFNKDGLPAVPFRTDDWPGLTVNNK